jgi:hypothetical protein
MTMCVHVFLYIKSTCIYLIYTCVLKTFKNKWLPLRLGYQSHSLKCTFTVYTQDHLSPGPPHLCGEATSTHS